MSTPIAGSLPTLVSSLYFSTIYFQNRPAAYRIGLALPVVALVSDSPGETAGGAVDPAGEVAGKVTDATKETVESTKKDLRDEATAEATRAKLNAVAEKGWKIAAKLTGSVYWPDDGLN